MTTFCAGVCARILEGRVEFLCRRVSYSWPQSPSIVFPGGNNKDLEETPVEILERVFPLWTGMSVLSSSLVFMERNTKETGEIIGPRFFWLVTDCCEDPTIGGKPELTSDTSLVWIEVRELRDSIYP